MKQLELDFTKTFIFTCRRYGGSVLQTDGLGDGFNLNLHNCLTKKRVFDEALVSPESFTFRISSVEAPTETFNNAFIHSVRHRDGYVNIVGQYNIPVP